MKTKIAFSFIAGLILGGLGCGYSVGCMCAKRYKSRIEALEEENARLCDDILEMDVDEHKKDMAEDLENKRAKKITIDDLRKKYRMDNWQDWCKDKEFAKTLVSVLDWNVDDCIAMNEATAKLMNEKIEEKKKQNDQKTYAELSKEYRNESFDEHFADRVGPTDEHDEDPEDEEEDIPEIKLIDQKTFNENLDYYDYEKMTYYQVDGVLVDEVGDVVYDEDEVIGREGSEKILHTEEDMMYSLDEASNKMYEIIVDHSTEFLCDMDFTDTLYRDTML